MWAREKAERIRYLWENGYDIGTIAREFGVTKNGAYSKIRRMKLGVRHEKKKWNRCRSKVVHTKADPCEKGQ